VKLDDDGLHGDSDLVAWWDREHWRILESMAMGAERPDMAKRVDEQGEAGPGLRELEQQMVVMKSVQVEHDSRLSRIWHDLDALRQRFDAFAAEVGKK
jgi:hypothetical protein